MKKVIKGISTSGCKFPNKAYKRLYHEAELFLKKENPCKISNGQCLRGRTGGRNFCCGVDIASKKSCPHCTSTGCNGNKPLACKLWLCVTAESCLTEKQLAKLEKLRKLAGFFGKASVMYRATKQDAKRIFLNFKVKKYI